MVKFLLHNTLGAWWARKRLAANPDLARNAPDENTLRRGCALPGVEWEYLRFVRAEGDGKWRPGAGTFPGWPKRAAEITYCDPCCGSGHFLVEAFGMFAALRQAEERLSPAEATCVVLRDNLFGLEIDGRCVQIAAFNVALAAWRLAGGPVDLPVPHIAWVGAPPPLSKSEFVALANGDAELERGLGALQDQFRQAPLFGSLIEMTGGDLVDPTRVARIEQSIAALVDKMRGAEPELTEGALAARGMTDAASILARRFTMQITNVPFLGRGKQQAALANQLAARFPSAKADLSTAMLMRMRALAEPGGTVAAVTPQNWLFLSSYKEMRMQLLKTDQLNITACLGPAAFHDMNWWAIQTALTAWTASSPGSNSTFLALDANTGRDLARKPEFMRSARIRVLKQTEQRSNPDAVITVSPIRSAHLLSAYAYPVEGLSTGDNPRFVRCFWEMPWRENGWEPFAGAPRDVSIFDGLSWSLSWKGGVGPLASQEGARVQGQAAWRKEGVLVGEKRNLPATMYQGAIHEKITAAVIPRDRSHLPAIWEFIASDVYRSEVRKLNLKLSVATGTLVKVPFDLAHWQKIAADKYRDGLPEPYSDDPTQWLFHGHPRYAQSGTELHLSLARLAGYRWPAESDAEMRLSIEARAYVSEAASLLEADADGLLPLVPVLGKRPLADRPRAYCAAAWGEFWASDSEAALIASACERAKDRPPKQLTFDTWLRSHAARQHSKLFHDRPFLWWITDGRPDGFTVVAHYHRLDRANLERVAYSMLNDWIDRQGDDPRAEAARILQDKLARILEGEKPYDIFVRWKPLKRQPLGWEPDLDDGVRLNIRPFIEAKVLVHVPNVRYGVDRGKDVPSAPWYHLFAGERRNDHHTSLAEKRGARAGKAAE